jgi:hypothetical protein
LSQSFQPFCSGYFWDLPFCPGQLGIPSSYFALPIIARKSSPHKLFCLGGLEPQSFQSQSPRCSHIYHCMVPFSLHTKISFNCHIPSLIVTSSSIFWEPLWLYCSHTKNSG